MITSSPLTGTPLGLQFDAVPQPWPVLSTTVLIAGKAENEDSVKQKSNSFFIKNWLVFWNWFQLRTQNTWKFITACLDVDSYTYVTYMFTLISHHFSGLYIITRFPWNNFSESTANKRTSRWRFGWSHHSHRDDCRNWPQPSSNFSRQWNRCGTASENISAYSCADVFYPARCKQARWWMGLPRWNG